MKFDQYEIYLINLDPTIGHEIKKTRPCLVISPNEMNRHIKTIMIAPMTTQSRAYPTRVMCMLQGKKIGLFSIKSGQLTNNGLSADLESWMIYQSLK